MKGAKQMMVSVVLIIIALIFLRIFVSPVAGTIMDTSQEVKEGCGLMGQILADIWHIEIC